MLLPLLLPLLIGGAPIDGSTATVLGDLVAEGAAVDHRVEVVTAADVKRALELEATRQMAGCNTNSESCLAEVAGALGAQLVLHGTLASLEDQLVVSLSLFDANNATSAGRVTVRATSTSELSEKLGPAAKQLVKARLDAQPSTKERVKLLCLELSREGAPASPAPASSSAANAMAIGGGVMAGIGALSLGTGIAIDLLVVGPLNERANNVATTQKQAEQLNEERQAPGIAAVLADLVGTVLLVGGGALFAGSFLVGAEEEGAP